MMWGEISMKIKAKHALLEIQTGRGAVNKALAKGEKVSVTLTAEIRYAFGDFDGTGQEFALDVKNVTAKVKKK